MTIFIAPKLLGDNFRTLPIHNQLWFREKGFSFVGLSSIFSNGKKPFGEQASREASFLLKLSSFRFILWFSVDLRCFCTSQYNCWSFNLIKLSLKIVVYIIDPTSKSCHAMDLISESFGITWEQMEYILDTHL